jgi:hypothetical protein
MEDGEAMVEELSQEKIPLKLIDLQLMQRDGLLKI